MSERKPRDYKKEYRDFHSKPKQKEERAIRNRNRRHAEKNGKVHKGDGFELHHSDHDVHNNKPENIKKVTKKYNRVNQ